MSFVISLDFELYWGVRDSRGPEYFDSLLGVHTVVPELVKLFNKYDVACTWATVGAIFCSNIECFKEFSPDNTPTYVKADFSPYVELNYLESLDENLLFAPMLIDHICHADRQEIASHTFSHYYALESGQNIEQFKADLYACKNILSEHNQSLKSLVFPRNQVNPDYLNVCKEFGYSCFRGNPTHWAYRAETREYRSIFKRAFRLIDSYIPLSGSLRQSVEVDEKSGMVNVPASLFLRPWNCKLSLLEPLRLWRIKWSMTRTAKNGGIFHLWWHPHNFSMYRNENLSFLEDILKHFQVLNKKYNMSSVTMDEVAQRHKHSKGQHE